VSLYLIVSVLACTLSALCIAFFNRSNKAHSPAVSIFAYALTVYYGLTAIRLLMGITPASKPLTLLLLLSGLYFCFKRGNVSDLWAVLAWPIQKLLNRHYFENGRHADFTLLITDTAQNESDINDLREALKKSKASGHYQSLVVYAPSDKNDGMQITHHLPAQLIGIIQKFLSVKKEPHIEHLTAAIPALQPARIYRQHNRRPPQNRQQPARRAKRQRDPHLRAIRKNPSNTRKQSPHYY
jgi:Putative 3TM holin, Phage_holin_3